MVILSAMNNADLTNAGQVNWWWVRHAPTGATGRMIGSTDLDAILPAKEVLQTVSRRLPDQATWLVSPMGRCRQTAAALGASDSCRIVEHFREQDFGRWDGRAYDDPEIRNSTKFWNNPGTSTPPEGESFSDMVTRVQQAIRQTTASGDIIVVAHAGVIRAATALALDLTPDQALRLEVDPLSLTRMTRFKTADNSEGVWSLKYLNQTVD
jgi:alpha-ribazole phosphatase